MTTDLWTLGRERLATELPAQQFNTWIRPLPAPQVTLAEDGSGVHVALRAPNRFILDWIRNQYAGLIETVLADLAQKPVRLELSLAPREASMALRAPSTATSLRLPLANAPAQQGRPVAAGTLVESALSAIEGTHATSTNTSGRSPPAKSISSLMPSFSRSS
jgi:chromosomal replication initiator protein